MIGIIGGGVSGLTCGVVLREAGYDVTIWTREPASATVSGVAAAIWHPFQVHPIERCLPWAALTYRRLTVLADDPQTGVVFVPGREIFSHPAADPLWRDTVRQFRRLDPAELPPSAVDGYAFETPITETPRYLRYLEARFVAAGGVVVARTVGSVTEALADAPIIVNCTGLAARELVGDDTLYPIRGQIVLLAPLPGTGFCLDDHGPHPTTYIIPRADGIVCGGTVQRDNWSTEVDPATAARIQADCAALMPALRGQPILAHKVGLRPGRPAVRLEAEELPGGVVIHNYGHGGSGYTLSWGCAEAVRELVAAAER